MCYSVAMKAAELALTEQERSTLQGWMRAGKTERRRHFRARVILELDRGGSNAEVAKRCGTREATISKWRGRFASSRLAGWRMPRAAASLLGTMRRRRG